MDNVKIFASIIDDGTKQQVAELSKSDAYKDCNIRIMPDCHVGTGCTIGSVIQFTDKVVPNTVGVDLNCGMLTVELGNMDINLEKLDAFIRENIPSGMNVREKRPCAIENTLIANVSRWKYIECSLGTLGGGNHFIEIDVDDEGNKYLVIHSGSRNLGKQVCEYWQNKAISNLTDDSEVRKKLVEKLKAEGRARDIQAELKKIHKPKINKELAYLEGEDLEGYLHDIQFCRNYAKSNRGLMAANIIHHLFGYTPLKIEAFTTLHNYVDIENRIVRKGAISAQKGEKVLIPMNMRDGSLICIGKGNPDWLCSAPHGAGRILSRIQAKETLKMEDFKDSMKEVYTTSVCESTLDEAPMVYKPSEKIMEDIKDTVKIVKAIKPIYNFKAKQ